jgi:hypothetical protein
MSPLCLSIIFNSHNLGGFSDSTSESGSARLRFPGLASSFLNFCLVQLRRGLALEARTEAGAEGARTLAAPEALAGTHAGTLEETCVPRSRTDLNKNLPP